MLKEPRPSRGAGAWVAQKSDASVYPVLLIESVIQSGSLGNRQSSPQGAGKAAPVKSMVGIQ